MGDRDLHPIDTLKKREILHYWILQTLSFFVFSSLISHNINKGIKKLRLEGSAIDRSRKTY